MSPSTHLINRVRSEFLEMPGLRLRVDQAQRLWNLDREGKDGRYSPKGDQIAYVRGPGSWYRKGYRGSSSDDIWLCNSEIALATGSGARVVPIRQPVMAYVLENPATTIVRASASRLRVAMQVGFAPS